MLYEFEIIDHKAAATRILRSALVEIRLVNCFQLIGNAVMQSAAQFQAVHTVAREIFFFVTRARYAADSWQSLGYFVAVNV